MSKGRHRPADLYSSFQLEFFEHLLSELKPESVHVLLAPSGSGKTAVVSSAISTLMGNQDLRRVLVVAARSELAVQWQYLLKDLDPTVLDGQSFRLLREQTKGEGAQWPEGTYIIKTSLLAQGEIQELVGAVHWGLVAVDDADVVADQILDLVQHLRTLEEGPAVLLLANRPSAAVQNLAGEGTVFDWRSAVFDLLARQSSVQVRNVVRWYRRTPEEAAIVRGAVQIARTLEEKDAVVLLHASLSSTSCLEDYLVNGLANERPQSDLFEQLLRELEQLHRDSKLDCLRALLGELIQAGSRHIVVFCEFRTTLEYLSAAVRELAPDVYFVHHGVNADGYEETIDSFKVTGGILVVSSAAEGLSLSYVRSIVHYDVPLSAAGFAQREGRYLRVGRSEPCEVYFLADQAEPLELETRLLKEAQEVNPLASEFDGEVQELIRTAIGRPKRGS